MARTKSSAAWLNEHVSDHWVHRAKAEGWRSRAVFKLMEIDDRDRLIRTGATVVDLGAAPGGWCQLAAQRAGERGRVVGIDLLDMAPIAGVDFIQGDFTEDTGLAELEKRLAGRAVDLVLSDMAPNMSGVTSADQARSMYLAELALEFACQHLQPAGAFLVKAFHGEGFEAYRRAMQAAFLQVAVRKPKASRDRSSEVYLLARGRK
jgi:23S rRNA (uridine2552-2'-O)-methyltransferase